MKIIRPLLFVLSASIMPETHAQGTVADYERAYSLYNKFNAKAVLDNPEGIEWINDSVFHYAINTSAGKEYIKVMYSGQGLTRHTESLNLQGITALINARPGMTQVKREDLTLQRLRVDDKNAHRVHFQYSGHNWTIDNAYSSTPTLMSCNPITRQGPRPKQRHWMEVDDERGAGPVTSPDGKMKAYIKNDNIHVSKADGSDERALTIDGTAGAYYSSWIKWSPDSKQVASCRIRPAEKRYVYYVESAPKSRLQPILHKQEYAKPGDELRTKRPTIVHVETGRVLIPSQELFDRQYDLYGPEWMKDGSAITFEYNERGHQHYRVLSMDATTGKVRTIVEEQSHTFVNYSRLYRHKLKNEKEMLWASERDNWNHLYLVDVQKGGIKRQITKGNWVVRNVVHVDEDNRRIIFTASGVNAQEDPYNIHYYSIGFDGKDMVSLTPEEGHHQATFNRSFTALVDKYSSVNKAPVTVLRTTHAPEKSVTLACADISQLLNEGWQAPQVFTAPGRDGKTPMWGIIQRPTNFDPSRKYPVIEYIYAGPGDAYTPKSFMPYNWNMTALAELGFIVVQLDAMGTSYRGKAFEEVCYKNLKDAGFPDRMAWMKAAAAKHPEMDITRVGIFGASAGGQEALGAVLFHPEFYKAAYSSCGCHDNRMDKIWWNEQWMGYPVDSSYVACSNVENAHKLTRPLMIVVGEMDDNVDPASTMQVVNALIKADKDFELVFLPGVAHTMGERFGEHKRFDFFVKNLWGINPPAWSEIKK